MCRTSAIARCAIRRICAVDSVTGMAQAAAPAQGTGLSLLAHGHVKSMPEVVRRSNGIGPREEMGQGHWAASIPSRASMDLVFPPIGTSLCFAGA